MLSCISSKKNFPQQKWKKKKKNIGMKHSLKLLHFVDKRYVGYCWGMLISRPVRRRKVWKNNNAFHLKTKYSMRENKLISYRKYKQNDTQILHKLRKLYNFCIELLSFMLETAYCMMCRFWFMSNCQWCTDGVL